MIGNLIFADERAMIRGWRVWGAGEVWGSFDRPLTTASSLLDCLCPLANAAPGFNFDPRTALG